MQALLKTTQGFDLTRETSCNGFAINSVQTEDTNIRIIFEIDGELYKFIDGELSSYIYDGKLEDILECGNTIEELLNLTGVVAFVRKRIYPIIAMSAPSNVEVLPRVKLGLKVDCYRDEYTRDELSPVLELQTEKLARLVSANYEKSVSGYAQANSQVRLRNDLGIWGDWLEFTDVVNKTANAVQFKNHYLVTTLDGSDLANVYNFKIDYVTDSENTAADIQELYFQEYELEFDAGTIYVLIKHTELEDSELKCYVKLSEKAKRRENISIGTGTGNLKTYYLGINNGVDLNINHNTLDITVDGAKFENYYYDTKFSTVEMTAPVGSSICASYEYLKYDVENWVEAEKQAETLIDGLYNTRFILRNAEKGKRITAIKIVATRESGRVENLNLGSGTNKFETFTLEKRAKSIECSGHWTYDEDSRELKVLSSEDINVSYDWVGTFPKVENVYIGYTAIVGG